MVYMELSWLNRYRQTKSSTYIRLEQMASRPLISSMGPLSRLIGRCLEHVHEPSLVYKALEDMAFFARTLATQWRQNKLSEIDASEEATFIDADALKSTVPRLWDVLKACMFTCVNILKVVMARTVADPSLAADTCMFFFLRRSDIQDQKKKLIT